MIGDDSKSCVSSFHCYIHGYVETHTHKHMFLQYVHSTHEQNKARFRRAQWGLEVGSLRWFSKVDNHLSTGHYVTIQKTIHMYYLNKSHKVHMDNLMNYHIISCSKMAINSCSQTISIYKRVYGLKGNKNLQLCGWDITKSLWFVVVTLF